VPWGSGEKTAKPNLLEGYMSQLEKSSRFSVGDNAVYPAHGVGIIEAVEKKVISGSTHLFYIMRILHNGMKIMIPKNNVQSVGLRQVISKAEVRKIYNILKEKEGPREQNQTWNRRYRQYTEKIKTGSVFEIAEVMRTLFQLKKSKELSFGEKKILDTVQNLLIKEISIVKRQKEEETREEMDSLMST
jgi:CarD family transcriptional regulator